MYYMGVASPTARLCSTLHLSRSAACRYPACRRRVEKAIKMYHLRQVFIFYARAVKRVQQERAAGKRFCLPTPAEIGRGHISRAQYNLVLNMLTLADPAAMARLHLAATTIQAAFRGYTVRQRRHTLSCKHRVILGALHAGAASWCRAMSVLGDCG
jgi:hypothetical protein